MGMTGQDRFVPTLKTPEAAESRPGMGGHHRPCRLRVVTKACRRLSSSSLMPEGASEEGTARGPFAFPEIVAASKVETRGRVCLCRLRPEGRRGSRRLPWSSPPVAARVSVSACWSLGVIVGKPTLAFVCALAAPFVKYSLIWRLLASLCAASSACFFFATQC